MSQLPVTPCQTLNPPPERRLGYVTCLLCGAMLIIDPEMPFDVVVQHDQWHQSVNQETVEA